MEIVHLDPEDSPLMPTPEEQLSEFGKWWEEPLTPALEEFVKKVEEHNAE